MKFLPKLYTNTITQQFSNVGPVEHYIHITRNNIDNNLQELTKTNKPNITKTDRQNIKKLKQACNTITIKPADKNLGIVLLNTDDYISQCTKHLSDTSTYILADNYPTDTIRRQITNTVINFKTQLQDYDKRLYNLLVSPSNHPRTPQFYGLPKIHKEFTRVPPIRPIVSQCASVLNPTARFIDHILQPLAKSYPDYLQNSTELSLQLQDLTVPDDAILVTADVTSLYPSIPQSEMLDIIYTEMCTHRHLLPFDPNLIIRLLHLNVNNTFFQFTDLTFQQTKGTTMGAPFSPTVANIYMSITLQRFLRTQTNKPLLLKRYIDDIFMIWIRTKTELDTFLLDLNNFNPAINYTHHYSTLSTDFLDLTIYKSHLFPFTNILDTKTYQKPQNLYQYTHFSSHHQESIFKAIITGELTRYIRTNTLEHTYIAMKFVFKQRLLARGYPERLIDTTFATVSFKSRQLLINPRHLPLQHCYPPLYKCLPPANFKLLKELVLKDFNLLTKFLPLPRFIALRHPTLYNLLVRTKLRPTDDQTLDIYTQLSSQLQTHPTTIPSNPLPKFSTQPPRTRKCNHPRCATCKSLNCNKFFTSSRTKTSFLLRHSFTCTSTNLIYLITCTECKKQYVGLTTKQLNTRFNHHRTNIINRKRTHISTHFNFLGHSLQHLTVQPIDTISSTSTTPLQDLRNLESFWISRLRTLQPAGLNVNP